MQTLVMYGTSDDLVESSGVDGADEFDCWLDGGKAGINASFSLGDELEIHAIYEGCWSFAVSQAEGDKPLPDWPIRIVNCPECSYSVQLEIDVPDGVRLKRIGRS